MNKVISKDGTEIAYTKIGSGHPLIMIDGAFCSRLFGPSVDGAPLLAKDFTVISYDRRGRNESGDNKSYSVECEIEDIDALIQMAGGSAYLFGHSSGGALGLLTAAANPKIKKLAVYGVPYVTKDNPSKHADAEKLLTDMINAGKREEAATYFLGDLSGLPSFALDGMRASPFWKTAIAMAHTLPYDAAIMGDCTIPAEKLNNLKIPVWIGTGGKADMKTQLGAKELAESLPTSELEILEGYDHRIPMKVLAQILKDFFSK